MSFLRVLVLHDLLQGVLHLFSDIASIRIFEEQRMVMREEINNFELHVACVLISLLILRIYVPYHLVRLHLHSRVVLRIELVVD